MREKELKVDIYADGADVENMIHMYHTGIVKGFTTNPTLMKKAGVSNYNKFAKDVLAEIKDMPVSFEVFSDDFDTMEKEASILSSYGENVYVKIPITNTRGEDSTELIGRLVRQGICVNVTAVFTVEQVEKVLSVIPNDGQVIISVFAGRIADAGCDPEDTIRKVKTLLSDYPKVRLLWASCREVFNIVQADRSGADIITVTSELLKKMSVLGKDLNQFSLETVQMFYNDGKSLGYTIE